jgi:hypothetical protein
MSTRVALAAVAVGAALLGGAVHGIGAAHADGEDSVGTAGAVPVVPVTTDLDPFQELYGDTGFNSWTTTADTDLAALSPTLASDFATSVDSFQADTTGGGNFIDGDDPFRFLVYHFDPSAFSANPGLGGLPDNAIGDFATGLDYTVFASGGSTLDVDLITLEADLFFGGF